MLEGDLHVPVPNFKRANWRSLDFAVVKNSAAGPAAARPRIVFIHRGVPPHMFSRDDP
jgi:hypothetical protein